MSDDLLDLGRAELLGAEAIGAPGSRRFRVFARSRRGTASLWMEREQMEALATAIDQLLAENANALVLRPVVQVNVPAPPSAPADFPAEADADFRVGQLQVGYDEEHGVVLLRAEPPRLIEPGADLEALEQMEFRPHLSLYLSHTQAERHSAHITGALAGGRPRCPLCGMPMQPAHVCEKQNGFHPIGLN
ncbi:MAG: DUF3090 family protein [Ktedonobacterales bacterium]|nr:DUF3090 family protein [Ktedonobacterales bacterium]